MKIAVGVLTHNQFRYDRHELFKRTVTSLVHDIDKISLELYIVDNGSTDETPEYVRSIGGTVLSDPITTCGHGMNATIGICAGSGAELVVFSNDDIEWRAGALPALVRFWSEAPADILIASGLLEDDFPWNTVRERVDYGGVPGLIRDTAPGGTWTLRAADWGKIAPVPEAAGYDDVPTCNRLRAKGYRVCQLDLAEHQGEHVSTWGNISRELGKPLDRAAWGLPVSMT
jgi:GT2 family glycosyltransferase